MTTPTYDYSDETVVVTGGTSGIGRAVAKRFGAAGAAVLVGDVRAEPADPDASDPTHEVVRERGGRAEFVRTDVSDAADVRTLIEAAEAFGGVDVMVNNAGVFRPGRLLEADPDDFDAMYGVNVRGVFLGTQAAARRMRDTEGQGRILNTASISSDLAQTTQSMYDATKAAVKMLTRTAAIELQRYGIRVNAVAPGGVDTDIVPEEAPSKDGPDGDKPVPIGRSAAPEELTGAYLFLASDDAAYVTGETLYVDGGYSAF